MLSGQSNLLISQTSNCSKFDSYGCNLPQDMRNLRTGCLKTEGKPIFCHSLAEFGATFWAGGITVSH